MKDAHKLFLLGLLAGLILGFAFGHRTKAERVKVLEATIRLEHETAAWYRDRVAMYEGR
jgi:hypothetical protein